MDAFRKLLPFLHPYRRRLVLAFLGVALLTLVQATPPMVLRYLINEIVQPGIRGDESAWALLLPVVALYASLPIIVGLTRFLSFQALMLASRRFVADIRLAAYDRILNQTMRYHGEMSAGMLVSRVMSDLNMLQRLLTGDTVRIVIDSIAFTFAVGMIFFISWKLGLVFLVVVTLYLVSYRIFSQRIQTATHLYRSAYDRIAGRLQETVEGVRQVRLYNREEWENETFLDRTSHSLDKLWEGRMSSVGLSVSCQAIAGYGSTIIFGLGGYFVLTGSLELGGLIAADRYVWMAIHPVITLTMIAGQMSETFVSVRRVQEILDAPVEVTSPPGAPRLPRGPGEVDFSNVHFAYEKGNPLYEGLDLYVAPGTTVALVGHTGCGKTTLTQLLMRHWDIQQGHIRIDGRDIREVDLRSLRAQFGVVLQDPVVFEGTVAENIAYSEPHASRDRIEEAAAAAELGNTIARLPDGLDTMMGTEGVRLSMGEKQRLSIARATLKDPMILIMDEATSALDSESEILIQKALSRVLAGRTSFVIAHRLSTITGADLIVVMDDGEILEQGTHEELLAKPGGTYQKFYEALRTGEEGEL